jgi:hypothetical protein
MSIKSLYTIALTCFPLITDTMTTPSSFFNIKNFGSEPTVHMYVMVAVSEDLSNDHLCNSTLTRMEPLKIKFILFYKLIKVVTTRVSGVIVLY